MRWYVMHEGKTAGPVGGEDIFAQGRQGQLLPGMHVREENGPWMPITQSPFASVVSIPAAPRAVASAGFGQSAKRIAIGVVSGVVLLVGGLTLVGALSKKTAAAPPLPVVTAAPEPSPAPPTLADRLVRATTLREATNLTKPLMGDVTGEDVNEGAAMLAMWWARQPSSFWTELLALPDSRRAEVMKDPEPYRGQRICMTGSVTQIFRDKSAPVRTPVYMGVLYHNGGFARFVAVHSTQGIVENTPARFCGIVIGLQSYSNVSGGTTHAVQVVGEFDIPTNGGTGLPQTDEW